MKRKGRFFFGALPSKYSGSVAGLQFGLGFAKTVFWGKGFGKTSADFPRGGGVWGGIRAGFGIPSLARLAIAKERKIL